MQFSMFITGSFTYWFLFRFQAPSGLPSFSCLNGDGEIRTHDPLLARQVLSQLSYTPIKPEIREARVRTRKAKLFCEVFLDLHIEPSVRFCKSRLPAISRNQLDYGSLFNFEWTQEDVRSLSSNIYSR